VRPQTLKTKPLVIQEPIDQEYAPERTTKDQDAKELILVVRETMVAIFENKKNCF
jgi:hypothetical protein